MPFLFGGYVVAAARSVFPGEGRFMPSVHSHPAKESHDYYLTSRGLKTGHILVSMTCCGGRYDSRKAGRGDQPRSCSALIKRWPIVAAYDQEVSLTQRSI